jgi:hypothetical protein
MPTNQTRLLKIYGELPAFFGRLGASPSPLPSPLGEGESSSVAGFTFADYVWAGLASGSYYSGITNGVVTPLLMTTPEPRQDRIKAQWALNEAAPFLPKSIDYFQGSYTSTKDMFHRSIMIPADTNQKMGELRVLQEKTTNGKTFPMVYTFETFRPKFPGEVTTNNVIKQLEATVRVRTVRLHTVPEVLPPKIPGETIVWDKRYTTDREGERVNFPMRRGHLVPDGLFYMSRGRLPEEPDVKAIKKFEDERDARPRVPPTH